MEKYDIVIYVIVIFVREGTKKIQETYCFEIHKGFVN